MRKLIVTALHSEAKPLIDLFRLKRESSSTKVPVYRSQSVALAVSGVGKVKSAVATAYLLAQEKNAKGIVIFNIGICGAADERARIGQMFFVHKVVDGSSGRTYYSDVLVKHGLPEAALTTFDKPVARKDLDEKFSGLADMEGSGFYESALTFLAPHQIVCLKIVSDFLRGERPEKSQISGLVEQNIEAIQRVASSYDLLDPFQIDVLGEEDCEILEQLRAHLRLTASQHHALLDLARGYKVREGGSLLELGRFLERPVSTKHERDRCFERIRSKLVGQ